MWVSARVRDDALALRTVRGGEGDEGVHDCIVEQHAGAESDDL